MSKSESYIRMREQNMTYAAIAREYGVSRQAVHQCIKKHGKLGINIKPTTVVFTGLRQWMCENHIFVVDLERITGKCLRKSLRSGNISRKNISAILEATDLSYEQAFGQKEKREN